MAADYLLNNIDNRKKTREHIRFLSEQMLNGQWKVTGDSIKIAKSGRILDGQHRLSAIIECGIPQEMLVIDGLDEDVFSVLDTGKNRSAADVLSIKGFKHYTHLAAFEILEDFQKDLGKVEDKINSLSFYGEGVKVSLWHAEKDADLVSLMINFAKDSVSKRISEHQRKFDQL